MPREPQQVTIHRSTHPATGGRAPDVESPGRRRHRLSCPPREQLGSHLLGVLDNAADDYVRFHTDVIGCRVCQASLADLRDQQSTAQEAVVQRRSKYFQSSAGYLSHDS